MPTNANHHDDSARLRRIDHLIETGEPGDDRLLNMLRRHVPRTRPEFAARLEHELLDDPALAANAHKLDSARPVIGSVAAQQAQQRVRHFPLMAAAALVIALLGVLAVVVQMGGSASPQTGAQSAVDASPTPTPTAGVMPTASPIMLGPIPSLVTPGPVVVVTATATATLTQTVIPTVPPFGTADQGIIWPSVRLAPVDEGQPPIGVGSRLAIYARLQQFASWADTRPGDVTDVLLTHQARIVNFLDYASEYVVELPDEVKPVASWLLANNAYFVYEVIGTP